MVPEKVGAFDGERHSVVGDLQHFEEPEPFYRLTVLPAKKGEQKAKDEYVYFPKGNGVTDAYSAIAAMRKVREREGTWQADTPLFTTGKGATWTVPEVRTLFKLSGAKLGLDTSFLGAHCGRIGGATDLFAEGCDAVMLQIQGRW